MNNESKKPVSQLIHDIRNSLTVILGYTDLLKEKMQNDHTALSYIQKIRDQEMKLKQLLDTFSQKK